jgi:hypothetical protein
MAHERYYDTTEKEKPTKFSSRLRGSSTPSYFSGYDAEGRPTYSVVRVVPQDVVAVIEAEIAAQEKKEAQELAEKKEVERETSDMTLFEQNVL